MNCLNIRRDDGDHTHDSILDSCSPSIHKDRFDWNVISPKKLFSPEKAEKQLSVLKEHPGEDIIKTEPEIEIDDAEEDVFEEAEEEKVEPVDPETSELTNELTTSDENEEMMPATEIKMSFSPTKLNECFVQQAEKKQSGAFEQKQQQISD